MEELQEFREYVREWAGPIDTHGPFLNPSVVEILKAPRRNSHGN